MILLDFSFKTCPGLVWNGVSSQEVLPALCPQHLLRLIGLCVDDAVLALFLFHWTRVLQATESSLERIMAAVLLRFYHACRSQGGKLSCDKAEADGLGMDPAVLTATPERLQALIQIKARLCSGVYRPVHQGVVGCKMSGSRSTIAGKYQ